MAREVAATRERGEGAFGGLEGLALVGVGAQPAEQLVKLQDRLGARERRLREPAYESDLLGSEVRVGTVDASEVNAAIEYLSGLVRDHGLPPKVLVVHRYTMAMVTNAAKIAPSPEVQVVMDMDGWGPPDRKYATYRHWIQGEPVQYTGFKLFYKNDVWQPGTRLLAVDSGRVVEISIERGGFERYVKLEHRWGESLYANTGDVLVEAGQMVARGDPIALSAFFVQVPAPFHFGIRIAPFNRHDGWGGFTDPQPFLPPDCLLLPEDSEEGAAPARRLHPMADEKPNMRRP